MFLKMTFKKARRKLKKLAKGKFHSIEYKVTEYHNGELEQKCTLYIDGTELHACGTWAAAFKSLQDELKPSPLKLEDENIEEIDIDK